ncbi:MAG: cell division protein FtsQ/DivIB [Acidimicrobiia bacterium]
MTDRNEHEPDPAALDELSRAFGGPIPPDGRPGERPDEPPKIIRIDDLSGAVEVRDEPLGERPPPEPADDAAPGEVVVIGGDDDLPDAVYVEGSLDRGSDRSIVFIEDDDTGDTVAADLGRDAQRGIEPRMRERRVAVKRAQSRKRLKWVVLVGALAAVAVAALAVLGSPLFAVRADRVVITGNVYTDADRLEEIVDDLVGTPSLRVDTTRLERELEAIPWVDRARVRVDFPHAASIELRERAAMTTYQGPDGRFRVLDREGRVLDVIENYPFAYLLLRGPDPVDLAPGEFAPTGYAAASELAKNLTPSIRGRVDHVEVTADGSRLVLVLDDGSAVFFGEARDFFAKLLRLESVLTANPDRLPGPIDVSTDDVTS